MSMGFFSNLFKGKTYTHPQLGVFTRVHKNKNEYAWRTFRNGVYLTVRGTSDEPYGEQMAFLENYNKEVDKLGEEVTWSLHNLFSVLPIEFEFTDWRQRFRIVAIHVERIENGRAKWRISFEDMKTRKTYYSMQVENGKPGEAYPD